MGGCSDPQRCISSCVMLYPLLPSRYILLFDSTLPFIWWRGAKWREEEQRWAAAARRGCGSGSSGNPATRRTHCQCLALPARATSQAGLQGIECTGCARDPSRPWS
jgi:hypothetical protein